MNKIRTVIAEDERLGRELLKKYLSAFPDLELIAECSNGFDSVKIINAEKPDLIFLDIQMPKLNGFEMLELLEEMPMVVFTTAFNEYAIKAFEVNAVDYLLKPFSEERLAEAIEKVKGRLKFSKPLTSVLPSTTDGSFLERVVVKEGSSIYFIPVSSIRYIEAQDDYVMIHSSDKRYLKQKTMKFYEDNLDPANFIRIHRSYICSVKEIKELELFEKESYQVILSDNKKLPVSKTGYDKLKEMFR